MFNLFYNFSSLNIKYFYIINYYSNNNILPYILKYISSLYSIEAVIIYYISSCLYFFHYIYKNNYNYFWPLYYKLTNVGSILCTLILTYFIMKYTINLPRPYCALPLHEIKTIAQLSKERCLSSFPSFHIASSIFINYILFPYLKIYQKIGAILVTVIVGISRIALAMHFPTDLLYSIPIAFCVIFVGNLIFKLLQNNLIRLIGTQIMKFKFR